MRLFSRKKGALQLSINAIVIIVLAMTLLGLGLTFIRGMFSNIVELSESTFEKISEELNGRLATSDEPLLFSKTTLSIERGSKSLEGVGVRNDADSSIDYGIKIITANCPQKKTDTAIECPDVEEWFDYFKGDEQYSLSPADNQVNKVVIDVPSGTTTGRYLLKIIGYTGTWPDGDDCSGSESCDQIGQTESFLTVT